jgi:ATP-dependent Clp protease protease subunit
MTIHVVHFAAGINQNTAQGLREVSFKALHNGATELHVHFACSGGTNFHGFELYHLMKSLPVPVTFHNVGNVESMGVVVFLAGSRRLACAESRFLLHPLHWGFEQGGVDISRLTEYAARLNDDVKRYASIFATVTNGANQPLDITSNLAHSHRILTASEALDCGLIHEISEAMIPAESMKWWVNG